MQTIDVKQLTQTIRSAIVALDNCDSGTAEDLLRSALSDVATYNHGDRFGKLAIIYVREESASADVASHR